MKKLLQLRIQVFQYSKLFFFNSFDLILDEENKDTSIWVYDNIKNPDGYVLIDFIKKISNKKKTNIIAFGPKRLFQVSIFSFLERVKIFFISSSFEDFVEKVFINEIKKQKSPIKNIIVGSSKGTITKIISKVSNFDIYEMQHGVLDDSYFPLEVHNFFTRSNDSIKILEKYASNVSLVSISNDLGIPPHKQTLITSNNDIDQIILWSKNPDGGISWSELKLFEDRIINFSKRISIPLIIKLHPRDSKIKFLFRHIFLNKETETGKNIFRKLSYLDKFNKMQSSQTILHLSCYSSALFNLVKENDFAINFVNTRADILKESYFWLQSYPLNFLNKLDYPIKATKFINE